jgi:hypothetical protein
VPRIFDYNFFSRLDGGFSHRVILQDERSAPFTRQQFERNPDLATA